ncbi:choice-of-anchor V domain-containing protein [Ferruginibacter sp.]
MSKKYLYTVIICAAIFITSQSGLLYSFQPPPNYTGAEGSTCAQCHGNFNNGGGGVATTGLPEGSFIAGQEYNFSVNLSHPTTRGRWGFAIDARDANNQPVGTFSSANPNALPNVSELSHHMAVFQTGTSFSYNNLKWTAPANPTLAQKTVTFYYAGNTANGDMGSTGDFIYTGTKQVTLLANIAPVVTITSPVTNTALPAGSSVTLTAAATDADGTIIKVEFYNNGVKFATDSTAPYTLTGTNVEAGTYVLTAKAFDNSGDSAVSSAVTLTLTACTGSGAITGEGYLNVTGTQVADLIASPIYPNNPSVTVPLNSFEYASVGDNYGARLRGYICAPLTGAYTFYIAGDDQAGLWLSTDENSNNKTLIAYNETPVGFQAWTTFATQKSAPITLTKGVRYYIETLHKQSASSNHLSVGWVMPGGAAEGPIPGSRLSPIGSLFPNLPNGVNAQSFVEAMKEVENNAALKVTVAPNPSSSYFTLNIKSSSNKAVTIKITDASGRLVETKQTATNSAIQVGNKLPAGIYFAEVLQDGKVQRMKLVKQ